MIADRYRVISLLGRGGMGEVYAADDLKLGQRVALKFLPANRGRDASWRDQFYAEVRMARQVSHPNVCRVYDVGESDGRLFLSMEFVDGEDLAGLLRRIGRLPDDKAVEVAQQLCAGLAAAHRSGVLHRDLKPSNVMLDGRGLARITDFGLAIAASDAEHERSPAGTPGYMAPELLAGGTPSVQSDLYALGLVLYELFTGKKPFEASSLGELHRRQTETNPTPPSNVVKNFDPAVEKTILRCLDRDPAQRPRSALSVSAALPGGDPLAAVLAAGETPSPEMVAAAGPQGSLRPAVAWSYFLSTVVLILFASMFLAPRFVNWGLAPMNKSPEVLADRAQALAEKLGYSGAMDRAFWFGSERGYTDYLAHNPPTLESQRRLAAQAWPSPVSFWYRQSPDWMTPWDLRSDADVSRGDPPFVTSGMLEIKLDVQGHLLYLRAVPPQVDPGGPNRDPDWNLLFTEAGLDKAQFASAGPKWLPPDPFDSIGDWEGHMTGQPDLLMHVTAASYRGTPVYFQIIAPWDKPTRATSATQSSRITDLISGGFAFLLAVLVVVGAFFARRNFRRGRVDAYGAWRMCVVVALLFVAGQILDFHFVPVPDQIFSQIDILGQSLLLALFTALWYMAVEPYARRTWPKLMVSWQRLLNGRFRDPLVGRDILLGIFASSLVTSLTSAAAAFKGASAISNVYNNFGVGPVSAVGYCLSNPAASCLQALLFLAVLSFSTGLLRRRWLGLGATGFLIFTSFSPTTTLDIFTYGVTAVVFLFVLVRFGLVASIASLTFDTFYFSPPLDFHRWYAGLALISLLVPFALLVWGFHASLGGQPLLGSALKDD